MTDTTHLALPLIAAAQAQKHVTHNEALRSLDALVMLSVDDRDLSAPPGSPAEGARYLVKATGTGAFAGKDGKIAHFRDGAFAFHTPRKGWIAYVADEDAVIVFDGSAWRPLLEAAAEFQNVALFGLATVADATNPLSARLNNALFAAKTVAAGGDGDLRWKLSKESAGGTTSLLFQDNFSGRAEIGLAGDDDLHLKVSNDGATWREGLVIAAATGKVSFPQGAIGLREKLTANRTYYVRTDGNNSNDGLSNSAGGAFLTLQKAWDTVLTLDLGGFAVTISVGSGTFTAGVVMSAPPVGGLVSFAGNSTTISVTSGNCFALLAPARVTLSGFTLQTMTSGQCLYASGAGAKFLLGTGMVFGVCAGAHIYVEANAEIASGNGYTISGSANFHIQANIGAIVQLGNITVTLSGTPAWAAAGILFAGNSVVSVFNVTFSGSATGKRYDGTANAVLNSYGAGSASAHFPGNANGTTASGAQQL
jgi:hypothetical protein